MTFRMSWADWSSSWFLSWGRAESWDGRAGGGKNKHERPSLPYSSQNAVVTSPCLLMPHSPQELELDHSGPYPTPGNTALAVATWQGTSDPFSPISPKYPENSTLLLMQICGRELSPGPVIKATWCLKDKKDCSQTREHSLPHQHQPSPQWSLPKNRPSNSLMPTFRGLPGSLPNFQIHQEPYSPT